jgi:hypothetical protein
MSRSNPCMFCLWLYISNTWFTCASIHRYVEFDHVKPSLAHDFFHIQSIGMIPLHQFKDAIHEEQYKKCKNKIKKTWYNLTQKVFLYYMYKIRISIQTFHPLKIFHILFGIKVWCLWNWILQQELSLNVNTMHRISDVEVQDPKLHDPKVLEMSCTHMQGS